MYKLDYIEEENGESSDNKIQEKETITFSIFVKTLFDEAKNFRKFFCWDKFAEGLFFRFVLPLYDIISDFLLANSLNSDEYKNDQFLSQFCTFLFYYCNTLPGKHVKCKCVKQL